MSTCAAESVAAVHNAARLDLELVVSVIIIHGTTVYVQGGRYFPDPTRARVNGSIMGGSLLKLAWIGIGLLLEFDVAGTRILTSPVLAITTQLAGVPLIH